MSRYQTAPSYSRGLRHDRDLERAVIAIREGLRCWTTRRSRALARAGWGEIVARRNGVRVDMRLFRLP